MTYDEFLLSIETEEHPGNMPVYLQALWYDAKGNWQKAHSLIDSLDDKNSCRVHAYLHRKEGDTGNADYWYRRANTKRPLTSLTEEWKDVTMSLLNV